MSSSPFSKSLFFFTCPKEKKKKKDGYESDVERDKEEGRERDF